MKNALPTSDSPANRSSRIAALGYDYAGQPKREAARCNLCGGNHLVIVAHRDRYGYPAEARGCLTCGLVFIDPVLTEDAYAHFYRGVYRPLVSAYHGRLIDAQSIQNEQQVYAAERGDVLAPFVYERGYQTMLDIGGSTGVVAHAWASRFGLTATVIDPAPLEIAEAHKLGLETVTGFIERYQPGSRSFDVVALNQTVDHLLDIAASLAAIRRVIAQTGLFVVDIVDFRAAYLRNWSVEEAIKIDHPFYLTDDTMRAYLRRAGFDVLRTDFAADHLHIGYVCAPAAPTVIALPSVEAVSAFFRELRFVHNAPATR